MNKVEFPALTGDSPLGILAAIGTVRLLADFTENTVLLSWNVRDRMAVLHGPWSSILDVVSELQAIVSKIPDGSLVPGVGGAFPPAGGTTDGLRVPQSQLRQTADELLADMTDTEQQETIRWLCSLTTDLVADPDGRAAISKLTAPAGRQTMKTMLEKPLESIQKDPDYIRQALCGWRRVPGVTGENLDHRALWDATEDGGGATGNMRGVPGATWLALMSFPLLRTTVSKRKRVTTSGWHTAGTTSGRGYDELRLPVWEQPLGTAGITALIEHPAMEQISSNRRNNADVLKALGVFHVCRARRYQPPGSQSAGVLTPITS